MPEHEHDVVLSFIDTNVWLYALLDVGESSRREVAKELVSQEAIVPSSQVINEACVNLLRKGALPESVIRDLIGAFYRKYVVVDVGESDLLVTSGLRERHSLSFWDSLIVASALQSGCEWLYSEDMQDGLVVEGVLTIRNPFRTS